MRIRLKHYQMSLLTIILCFYTIKANAGEISKTNDIKDKYQENEVKDRSQVLKISKFLKSGNLRNKIKFTADEITFSKETKVLSLEGHYKIEFNGLEFTGDRITINVEEILKNE
jgi:lipopolysaccharide export system protein LptA